MFEAFIWMFKKENFKKHYLILICCSLLTNLTLILFLMGKITSIISMAFAGLIMFITGLFLCGYFWNLTENIIDAEADISANTVYNGKIKTFLKIELPTLKIFKLIWRGFASIIANILILIPYFLLIYLANLSAAVKPSTLMLLPFIMLFYLLFFPALFWNYAKSNSVFAVLNITKAVYIMGNYPGRYIVKAFQLAVIYILFTVLTVFLTNTTDIFVYIAILPVAIYLTLVYAYILGTLVPNEEF